MNPKPAERDVFIERVKQWSTNTEFEWRWRVYWLENDGDRQETIVGSEDAARVYARQVAAVKSRKAWIPGPDGAWTLIT
jgi:hypothetical protein